jgi:hypothetical protein
VKRPDVAVFLTVEAILNGTFKGSGATVFSLENDGVGLGKISPNVPQDIIKRLEAQKAGSSRERSRSPGPLEERHQAYVTSARGPDLPRCHKRPSSSGFPRIHCSLESVADLAERLGNAYWRAAGDPAPAGGASSSSATASGKDGEHRRRCERRPQHSRSGSHVPASRRTARPKYKMKPLPVTVAVRCLSKTVVFSGDGSFCQAQCRFRAWCGGRSDRPEMPWSPVFLSCQRDERTQVVRVRLDTPRPCRRSGLRRPLEPFRCRRLR